MKYIFLIAALILMSCGNDSSKKTSDTESQVEQKAEKVDPKNDKGIGPVTSISLGEINTAMVDEGKEIFKSKCSTCHKMNKRYIGPQLSGITERRTPEWIMNMILNPEEMVQKNEAAKQLLMEYSAPMANQSLTEDEARAILEYFRTIN